MSATATPARWIGGRAFDLAFFFGSSAAAMALGALAVARPVVAVPLWWAWMLLVDGPHLLATFTRTYLDAGERQRHRRLFLTSLLWLLPGPLCWAAAMLTGQPLAFDAFLLFATLWAYHHAVRQHYGVLSVYHRLDQTAPGPRRWDGFFVHALPWGMYLLFLGTHPWSRKALLLPEALNGPEQAAARAGAALLALGTLTYLGSVAVRAWRGERLRPALFVVGPVVGMLAYSLFVIAGAEPVLPHPTDPEQVFLVSGFVGGSVHGVQYLGMVVATNRRRYAERGGDSVVARLGRAPWLCYGALVAASLGYLLINLVRGNSPGAWLEASQPAAKLMLGLYWGLFMHHYWLDQKIWHPSHDAGLRAELGLGGG
jgi:hypothetical protein